MDLRHGSGEQSLWQLNQDDLFADPTSIQQMTRVDYVSSVGFNPMDNLIYHFGGHSSWTDDPNRFAGGRTVS